MVTTFAKCLALIVMLATLPACGTLYLAQAARGQWQVMRERHPIEKVVADQRTSPDLRARLTEVRAARDFAISELGLPDNASYRSYADVHRSYVVWNVVAAPEFSVEPHRWCFPIAGCVAYRGYFDEAKAQSYALGLRAQGFDTMVAGVPAYSTLGRTADPVLNTMLVYGDSELAAMIFHELSHQLVYVAGDSEFNEAFAVAVEEAGLERWLKSRGRENDLQRYRANAALQRESIKLFMRRRDELARLYASKLSPPTMRERKRAIFGALQADIQALARSRHAPLLYAAWLHQGLNNAHLASVATYFDCVAGFEGLLKAAQGDLPAFYEKVRQLAGQPRTERHAQLCTGSPDASVTNR